MIGWILAGAFYALGAYLNYEATRYAEAVSGGEVNYPYQIFAWPWVVITDIYDDLAR